MNAAVPRAINPRMQIARALLPTLQTSAPEAIIRVHVAMTRNLAAGGLNPRPARNRETDPPPRFPRSAARKGMAAHIPLARYVIPRSSLRYVGSQLIRKF